MITRKTNKEPYQRLEGKIMARKNKTEEEIILEGNEKEIHDLQKSLIEGREESRKDFKNAMIEAGFSEKQAEFLIAWTDMTHANLYHANSMHSKLIKKYIDSKFQ